MRSEATENYHLTTIVTHYALAHPEIAFTLASNGREVISVSPARDLRERPFRSSVPDCSKACCRSRADAITSQRFRASSRPA
jgi:hypothetical protein